MGFRLLVRRAAVDAVRKLPRPAGGRLSAESAEPLQLGHSRPGADGLPARSARLPLCSVSLKSVLFGLALTFFPGRFTRCSAKYLSARMVTFLNFIYIFEHVVL